MGLEKSAAGMIQTLAEAPPLPMTEAAYLPGVAYDEMFTPDGEVRPHYHPPARPHVDPRRGRAGGPAADA